MKGIKGSMGILYWWTETLQLTDEEEADMVAHVFLVKVVILKIINEEGERGRVVTVAENDETPQ